ncbi:MAG: MaoC family dehydratase N-terminal domain-containing protein [Acidimicrobiia bacterium]|nr:MaoC family dehydratase N-terminal domain-containing protein [Acidimicrobiia bacterium]
MPVTTSLVGAQLEPATHTVDARWAMAYAAAIDDTNDRYFDTTRADGVVAHPMFAVCPEWPVIVSGRAASERWNITADETRRSVHATHDLTVHRLIRAGDLLTTTAVYTGVEQRRPGAFVSIRLETRDSDGELVATTDQGNLYLGVHTVGDDRPASSPATGLEHPVADAEGAPGEPPIGVRVDVPRGAAHTYTECARIWNPIHTDEAVALAAGLPGIILHGTATMALAVSRIVDAFADGDPHRVRRIVGRFAAQVPRPSSIMVRHQRNRPTPGGSTTISYDVLTESGGLAIDRGVVLID